MSGSSEAEEENDPDGPFAFRRKAGCQYYAVSMEIIVIVFCCFTKTVVTMS